MTDESKLGEIEGEGALAAYPDNAAALQEIVQGVAQLRRWSRFSVRVIVTACIAVFTAVFTAILLPELHSNDRSPAWSPHQLASDSRASDACTQAMEQLRLTQEEAAKLQSAKETAEKEAAELRLENNALRLDRNLNRIATRAPGRVSNPAELPAPMAVAGGRKSEPAELPAPMVGPNAVTKLSGDVPVITVTGVDGASTDVIAKMCIDTSGHVTSVKLIKALPEISDELQHILGGWRYKPYTNPAGEISPACFPLQFRVVFRRTD